MENNAEIDDCVYLETLFKVEDVETTGIPIEIVGECLPGDKEDYVDIEDLLCEPETVSLVIEKIDEPPKKEQETVVREYNDTGTTLTDFDIKNHEDPATQDCRLTIPDNSTEEVFFEIYPDSLIETVALEIKDLQAEKDDIAIFEVVIT
jgi:hypothetical protein